MLPCLRLQQCLLAELELLFMLHRDESDDRCFSQQQIAYDMFKLCDMRATTVERDAITPQRSPSIDSWRATASSLTVLCRPLLSQIAH